jgi:hypothetical protein
LARVSFRKRSDHGIAARKKWLDVKWKTWPRQPDQLLRGRTAARAGIGSADSGASVRGDGGWVLGEGNAKAAGKRGPASTLQRQMEQISSLPKSKQKFITEMLDALIKQQQVG